MKQLKNNRGLWAGIGVLLVFILLPAPEGLSAGAMRAAGVTLLMAIWWITEALPIYVTALIPLVLFPVLGILDAGKTAENYGHNYVLMLLGGFMLAGAIEIHGLHRRIALSIIRVFGTSRKRIILSFMIATALLSMWIANVAVTLMMMPIGIAVISREESDSKQKTKFGLALMLAIAYAASIGGTGTLIGTPPNMVFAGMIDKFFPEMPGISFFQWLKMGVPLIILFIPVIWLYIVRYFRVSGEFMGSASILNKEYKALGKISAAEKRVLLIFIFTALGWIFRRDFELDNMVIPGWASLLGVKEFAHDSTVALAAAILLFIVPAAGQSDRRLLTWPEASAIPWGVVMIVGGGYAIAESFSVTHLADWIGNQLAFIGDFPVFVILLVVIAVMIFVTEINSNTATANIFLPVLGTMAVAGNIHPYLLMIPATIACSFAFMLPSGTGTNAVIFGSERVSIPEMARCGIWLNLICIVLVTMFMYLVAVPMFDLNSGTPS